MDIKQKLNSKLKSLVKVPSNLTTSDFKPPNFQINNLFHHNNHQETGLADLNAQSAESIRYIQEKHLPIVAQYTKQKELRELQINPYLTNPKLELEIINSIEEIYYSDLIENDDNSNDQISIESTDCFDPFEHILNKLPDTMDLGFIIEEKKKLNKQLMVVTKRVSDLIQQNQSTYNKELASVIELQEILTNAINICSSGRSKLDVAKKNLTYPNLNIISAYRRREILISLLKEFYTIKTLLQTEITLNDLIIEEEDYAGAIKLCLECLKIIGSLNHYKCVTDLGAKLNYTIVMTEERLDQALSKLCINFNENQFNKIKETFALLGKTQFLYDQLLVHFCAAINEKMFKIANSYVELCTNLNESFGSSTNNSSMKERTFEDVCSALSSDCFLSCLIDLNKSMWHIMVNYKKFIDNVYNESGKKNKNELINHHSQQDNELDNELDSQNDESHSQSDNRTEERSDEQVMDCNLVLIKQKLKYGLTKIWSEIEVKLTILIRNHNLSIYSFDDFISMINIVHRMIKIGCQFSNTTKSVQLEEALKKATSEYFYIYHKTKMEEIKVFLETDLWELIPMKGFSIEQLHEFNFLKNKQYLNAKNDENKKIEDYFDLKSIELKSKETPFDDFAAHKKNGNKSESDQQQLDNHHLQDSHDETDDKTPVVITNSSLNILRIVGKYCQIMIILNQISLDVLLCIFHLFDYYLYGIYLFFANGNEFDRQNISSFYSPSSNLLNLLRRIESTLIVNKGTLNDNRIKFYAPQLSSLVNLNDKDRLFGLLERGIGVESLVFLGNQLNKIYEPLLSLINSKDKVWLDQFFNQTVNISVELREPIFMYVASKYIQHEQIVQSMEKVNWEIRDYVSTQSIC